MANEYWLEAVFFRNGSQQRAETTAMLSKAIAEDKWKRIMAILEA